MSDRNAVHSILNIFTLNIYLEYFFPTNQVFAGEYYRHNECGIINSEDAAYVLAFATMMVHTDLHNPAVRRHMTKTDWLRMNRGKNICLK